MERSCWGCAMDYIGRWKAGELVPVVATDSGQVHLPSETEKPNDFLCPDCFEEAIGEAA